MSHPIITYAKDVEESNKQLRRGTYQDRGRTVGALAGAGLGAAAVGGLHLKMAVKGRRLKPGMGKRLATTYAVGSGVGALGGALIGKTSGTFVRREKPTPKGKEKLFQTMNPTTKARLISLNAKLSRRVEFVAQKEEDHTIRNTAIAAGGLAAAYGGLSAYRGAKRMKSEYGSGPDNLKQWGSAVRDGHATNVADVKNAYGKVGAAGVAAKRATEVPLAQAKQTMSNVGGKVARAAQGMKQTANQTVGAIRRKIGKGNISRFPMVLAK